LLTGGNSRSDEPYGGESREVIDMMEEHEVFDFLYEKFIRTKQDLIRAVPRITEIQAEVDARKIMLEAYGEAVEELIKKYPEVAGMLQADLIRARKIIAGLGYKGATEEYKTPVPPSFMRRLMRVKNSIAFVLHKLGFPLVYQCAECGTIFHDNGTLHMVHVGCFLDLIPVCYRCNTLYYNDEDPTVDTKWQYEAVVYHRFWV